MLPISANLRSLPILAAGRMSQSATGGTGVYREGEARQGVINR